jgi:hypothetical protein
MCKPHIRACSAINEWARLALAGASSNSSSLNFIGIKAGARRAQYRHVRIHQQGLIAWFGNVCMASGQDVLNHMVYMRETHARSGQCRFCPLGAAPRCRGL